MLILRVSFAHTKVFCFFVFLLHESAILLSVPFEDIFQSGFARDLQPYGLPCMSVSDKFSRLVNVVIIVIVGINVPLTTLFEIDTVKIYIFCTILLRRSL